MPDDPALRLFPDEFVPNVEASDAYKRWAKSSPADRARWEAFRTGLLAKQPVTLPVMSTKFGKALVAAGKEHMSITRLFGSPVNPFPPPDPAPPPPPPPPPSSRQGLLWEYLGSGTSPPTHVADYDTLILGWSGNAAAGANPSVRQALPYMSMVSCKTGAGGAYHFGVTSEEARANGWVLLTTTGAEMTNVGYANVPLGDMGNPAYQARWCSNVEALINAWGVDGVYIDDTLYHYTGIAGPVTSAKYPTQPQWLAAVASFAQAIYGYFQPLGKFVCYNAGGWHPGGNDDAGDLSLALWNAIVGYSDGLQSETWVYHYNWPPTYKKLTSNWTGNMRLPALCRAQNKVFFCLSRLGADVRDYQLYSMLLETTNGSAGWSPNDPSYSNYDPNAVWNTTYDRVLTLGDALQDRVQNGSRWQRQFEGGLVWVDPTNGTYGVL